MSHRFVPKLSKWPFYLGDLLLLALAVWIIRQSPNPFAPWPLFFLVTCGALGAWLCALPFLVEYRAELAFAEADALTNAVDQIKNLQTLSNQISFATAQWQLVQEQSAKTLISAKEMAEQMTAEAKSFGEFMKRANDLEKTHLRLEADKLRRGEGEWLQIVVRLLDHVYALYQAGLRSGQPALREQLLNFQNACREIVRRLGIVAFEVETDTPFNEKAHQLMDSEARPPAGARVAEMLAVGYTFQGQLLRGAIVSVKLPAEATPEPAAPLSLDSQG
jgi:molecular chaperone GrpE (heat shock protein)